VLTAVEAEPAAPVLAALAASTAVPRTAVGLAMGSQADETKNQRSFTMSFQVGDLSVELVEALAPLMPRLKQRDKALADQLSRAASSICLNLGEAT
jgi:hypothetical protein